MLAVFAVFLKLELLRAGAFLLADGAIAVVIALVALFVGKLVLDRTVFARCADRPVALWVVVLVGLALGVVTVIPFAGAMLVSGVPIDEPPFPGLLVSGAVRCAILFPLATYLMGLRRWYRIERDRAEHDLVRAEAARMEAGDAVEATRGLIIETARRELGPTQQEAGDLLRVAAQSEAPADVSRAAESLRSAARSAVRSTSHDLWVDDHAGATIRWRSVVPGAIVRYPLPMLLPAMLIVGFVIARAETSSGAWVLVLASILAGLACLAGVFLMGRLVIARAPAAAPVVTAVAVLAAPIAVAFASAAVLGRIPAGITVFGVTVVVAVFTVASSVVLMIRDSGAAVIQALVDERALADAQQAALEVVNARLSRELAAHLHGTVQPQLVAASVALDAAVQRDDPAAIAAAVAQAEAALGMGMEAPRAQASRPAGEVAEGVAARWDAMLDLSVEIDGADPGAPVPAGVVRVLDECLNNALVHGNATRAHVRVAAVPEGWSVEVDDDGIGPAGGAPGLGASVLDEVTGGAWSIAPGRDGGAAVRAVIAHAAVGAARDGRG